MADDIGHPLPRQASQRPLRVVVPFHVCEPATRCRCLGVGPVRGLQRRIPHPLGTVSPFLRRLGLGMVPIGRVLGFGQVRPQRGNLLAQYLPALLGRVRPLVGSVQRVP